MNIVTIIIYLLYIVAFLIQSYVIHEQGKLIKSSLDLNEKLLDTNDELIKMLSGKCSTD